MASSDPGIKRIVLDQRWSLHDPATIRFAAELAELLHVGLLGRVVDPGALNLAGLSCVREFRLLERQWVAFDDRDAMHASELAISAVRRTFTETVRTTSVSWSFQVVDRRPVAKEVKEAKEAEEPDSRDSTGGDIIVVRHGPQSSQPIALMLDEAFRTARGVLIVPPQIQRRRGRVVALSNSADDPVVSVAEGVAQALGEPMLRMNWPFDIFSRIGKDVRLIVVRRGLYDDMTLAVAVSRLGIPILVLRD